MFSLILDAISCHQSPKPIYFVLIYIEDNLIGFLQQLHALFLAISLEMGTIKPTYAD